MRGHDFHRLSSLRHQIYDCFGQINSHHLLCNIGVFFSGIHLSVASATTVLINYINTHLKSYDKRKLENNFFFFFSQLHCFQASCKSREEKYTWTITWIFVTETAIFDEPLISFYLAPTWVFLNILLVLTSLMQVLYFFTIS